MSQLLQVATRGGGAIPLVAIPSAPVYVDQGIPFQDDEGTVAVAVTVAGVIAYYHQGLPFTSDGRLAATNDKPVVRYGSGGAPFDLEGLLVFGSGPVDHYSAGIPYTVDGQIAAVGAGP